jgi:hypothetical protein
MTTLTTYGPGGFDPEAPDGNVISVATVPTDPVDPAALAAIEHARVLGFTDDMIRVMYPAIADAI